MPIFVLSMKKAKKFTIISCLLLVLCMTGNAHRSLAKQRIKTEQKKALPQYSRVQIPEDSIASVNKKKTLGFKVKDASWQGTYEYCSVLNKLTLSQSQRSKNLCLITMNQRKYCYYISM